MASESIISLLSPRYATESKKSFSFTEESEPTRVILHEGYLSKKGQFNRSWKQRYFILYSDKRLAYFSSKSSLTPIKEINLSTVTELSLLPYSNKPEKAKRKSSNSRSFADIFISNKARPHSSDDDDDDAIEYD